MCLHFRVSSRAAQQLYEKEKSLCDTLISYMEKLHTSLVHLPEIQGAASIDKEPVVSLSASTNMFLRECILLSVSLAFGIDKI